MSYVVKPIATEGTTWKVHMCQEIKLDIDIILKNEHPSCRFLITATKQKKTRTNTTWVVIVTKQKENKEQANMSPNRVGYLCMPHILQYRSSFFKLSFFNFVLAYYLDIVKAQASKELSPPLAPNDEQDTLESSFYTEAITWILRLLALNLKTESLVSGDQTGIAVKIRFSRLSMHAIQDCTCICLRTTSSG